MKNNLPEKASCLKRFCTAEGAATLALFLSLIALAYPGVMTNDSFGWLIRARSGIFSDIQPVGATLLWQILEKIYPGPFLFVVLNIAMIFFSARYLFQTGIGHFQKSSWLAFISLALFSLWPALLTITGIVWRDVTGLGIAMMTAAIAVLSSQQAPMNRIRWALLVATMLILILAGALCRYNHVAGILPFVILASWYLFPLKCKLYLRLIVTVTASFAVCVLATVFSMWLTTSLAANEKSYASQPQDEYLLARLSIETSQNLFPQDLYPRLTYDKIRNAFETHGNRTYAMVFWTAYSREDNPDLPRIHDQERYAKVRSALKSAIDKNLYTYLAIRADEALRWFDPKRTYRNGTLRTETSDASIFKDKITVNFPTKKPDWSAQILKSIDKLNGYSVINNPVYTMLLSLIASAAAIFILPRQQWMIISLFSISAVFHHISVALNAYVANFRFIHQSIAFAVMAIILFMVCSGLLLAKRYVLSKKGQ